MFSQTINYVNAHSILTPTQYGFKSNYSTTHAVLDIVSTCYDNIKSKNHPAFVLLDLAQPFDTVTKNLSTPQVNVNRSAGLIKIATKLKYFGVITDNKLNFKDYINFVETKISRSLGILGKLKYYLDFTCLLKISYALIHFDVNCGLIIRGNTDSSYLTRLTILINN